MLNFLVTYFNDITSFRENPKEAVGFLRSKTDLKKADSLESRVSRLERSYGGFANLKCGK